MTPPNDNHLAAEMIATADALRQVRVALYRRMIDSGSPAADAGHVRVVLVEGVAVAIALEQLASQLGAAKD
jgi:hypothetical protein